MSLLLLNPAWLDTAWSFALVIGVDLSMSADNAIVIALAAASVPPARRPRVILLGTLAAATLRVILAMASQRLLSVIGLTLTGGILLLYVAQKFWQEMKGLDSDDDGDKPVVADDDAKSFRRVIVRIVVGDLSMSLDNILAVAGAARGHAVVLITGLTLSVLLTGMAAGPLARIMERRKWIGTAGVIMIAWIALSMIHDGAMDVWTRLHHP